MLPPAPPCHLPRFPWTFTSLKAFLDLWKLGDTVAVTTPLLCLLCLDSDSELEGQELCLVHTA